ncbi:uncharacterized protein LTR77_005117 [Saxophila tyrrhenica]|uniref:Uncharacterized protein n=1 Tax=Saxophila tyrrhenica TaxID=1690608 RepID=A0AAV9PBC1_9PEZI|nr:hypothetical protein LTR77_005117 [Saxophila tyrrhenica]
MAGSNDQTTRLSAHQPKTPRVTVDEIWARATSLAVLEGRFDWHCTSWLGLKLKPSTRRGITQALTLEDSIKPETSDYYGRLFHNDILLPAYTEIQKVPMDFVGNWELLKLESDAARKVDPNKKVANTPKYVRMHKDSIDFDMMWQQMKINIEFHPHHRDKWHDVFPALVYKSWSHSCAATEMEAWERITKDAEDQVNASYLLPDKIYSSYRTVSSSHALDVLDAPNGTRKRSSAASTREAGAGTQSKRIKTEPA